jgi:hypothetical protein
MTSKPYVKGFAQGLQNPHCDVKMGEHFTKWVHWIGAWKCCWLCAAIKLHLCWAASNRQFCAKCRMAEKGKRWEETARSHPDWNDNMAFVVDNQDHPQVIEICSQLMRLLGLIHDAGYATQGLFLAMSNLVMWYHWNKQPFVQLPF